MLHFLKAQGATEYLVLLAVILVIALASIALLGFFPGTASDSQVAESQIYWKSASPIAIVDTGGAYYAEDFVQRKESAAYIKIRNTGSYPLRLSSIMAGKTSTYPPGSCSSILSFYDDSTASALDLSSISLSPGEETCIGSMTIPDSICRNHAMLFRLSTPGQGCYFSNSNGILWAPGITVCNSDGTGTMVIPGLSFEYVEYIEGQAITKKQIGAKDFVVKCIGVGTNWP